MSDAGRRPHAAVAAFLIAGFAGCGGGGGGAEAPPPATSTPPAATRPNIVLIVTDDLDLEAARPTYMPRLQSLVADRGMTFTNAFSPTPLCSPSRASFLTGQYAHNHGLLSNQLPLGGFEKWAASGKESATVAVALKNAGYRTILVGKYMNAYQPGNPPYVAVGWDDWHALFSNRSQDPYFDYAFNDNGTITTYGSRPEDYVTDVMTRIALDSLRRAESLNDGQPFFLYLAPTAPHTPALRHPKYEGQFTELAAPRTPSFDEADISDKPGWLRSFPPFTDRDERRIDFLYRDRIACMQSVDEMLQALVDELERTGEMANTLIVFTSDNGFFLGPHRFNRGKGAAYEEAIRIPLVVRGPGVPAGQVRGEMVANIDIAPTLAALAGATLGAEADGRSLVPLLRGDGAGDWRRDLLLEFWANRDPDDPEGDGIPTWQALRSASQTYVDYDGGDGELYDLVRDPFQLENQYASTPAATLQPLEARLAALKACRGASCR
jgi:arylsulfatase A-like enzyme